MTDDAARRIGRSGGVPGRGGDIVMTLDTGAGAVIGKVTAVVDAGSAVAIGVSCAWQSGNGEGNVDQEVLVIGLATGGGLRRVADRADMAIVAIRVSAVVVGVNVMTVAGGT